MAATRKGRDLESFFRDHWLEIESERLDGYERMFAWRPEQDVLLAPAAIEAGHRALDFGSGPGLFAVELARRVGPHGHVHGVDINPEFVARSRERAHREGLAERMTFHLVDGPPLPLADASIDRIVCKNVLEYVPDLPATLRDLHRLQPPGALLHAVDTDWGFVIVEPWAPETVAEFFRAAAPAFREPNIGRRLPAALARAGYRDVSTAVHAIVDTSGLTILVLQNMASYIRQFESMSEERLADLLAEVEGAIAAGEYLLVLPQFLVTGRA